METMDYLDAVDGYSPFFEDYVGSVDACIRHGQSNRLTVDQDVIGTKFPVIAL